MSRTTINLDDELVERAMRLFHLSTKHEAVQLALEHLVNRPMSKEEMLAMQGTGWTSDLDAIREGTGPTSLSRGPG